MTHSFALIALGLMACTSDPAPPGSDSGTQDSDLPLIWGPAVAEDHDDDPDVVEVHLTAAETDVAWVGQDDETTVWAYNGQVPGPMIQLVEGQTLRVVFDNQLEEDESTIHWHGLRISDDMDGVPAIQDPVQPGEEFVYEFTPPDAGTYWYHPHVRSYEQIERGLQGSIVIHEADAPIPARDRYFVLDDAYLRDGGGFYGFTLSHMEQMHGRLGNTLMANGQAVTGDNGAALEDSVRPGAPERWRVVNTANARTMYLDVTGASWRVIAVDGTLLPEPYQQSRLTLPVGRRFDLEVIPDGDEDLVELRVLLPSSTGLYDKYPVFEGSIEGDKGDYEWLDWPSDPLPATSHEVEQELTLELDGYNQASGDIAWTINGDVYGEHEDIQVDANTSSIIRIEDFSGLEHPYHLHGQFFQVLEVDGEPAGEEYSGLLDTVLVEGEQSLTLHTTFDNPGRWMSHCHILEHAELGMMTEMVVE